MKRRSVQFQLFDDRPLWQRWAVAIAGLLLLFLAPVLAYAQGGGADTVRLVWTAPGDDGAIGTAAGYEMRVSPSPITLASWSSASVVGGAPAPLASGTRQGFTVGGLSIDTTYYFAVRTVDDVGNWSGLSNVVRWDWVADTAPPLAPSGISAVRLGGDVRVSWSANAEPDLDGYEVYRSPASGGPFTLVTATLVSGTQHLDTAVPAGAASVWYRVSARDLSGNESPPSASVQVQLVAPRTEWSLSPGYPNPSAGGQPVCIPIAAPAAGAGNAAIDVTDAGGHRVRHIALASATSCGTAGVAWDGKNDAGRAVAPGVYRAWLNAGDTHLHVKLVRVP